MVILSITNIKADLKEKEKNIMIQKANLEKSLEIYNFMEEDFPKSEIPNHKKFLELTEKNIHNVYIYEENKQEIAYFITMEKDEKVLITHLAVIKKYRGKGVGKRFLEEIKKFLSDKKLLIVEVETEKNAKDKQELTIIEKRLRYYLNSGFEKCERLEYKMFNADYYILTYSKSVNKITNKEVKQTIENIYDGLLSKNNLIIKII